MQLKNIFSTELLDEYKSGKRTFSNINLQYTDIPQTVLKDIVIKDSRLFFVTFRDCDLSNSRFVNCEIFYGSFYGGNLEKAVFDRCSIDFTLFDMTMVRSTRFDNSRLNWTAIFNMPAGELDMTSSMLFKVFTDPSQVTPRDIEEARLLIGPVLDKLDISIKAKITKELQQDSDRHDIDTKERNVRGDEYGKITSASSDKAPLAYGAHIRELSDAVISAYNTANPYQGKKDSKKDAYSQ